MAIIFLWRARSHPDKGRDRTNVKSSGVGFGMSAKLLATNIVGDGDRLRFVCFMDRSIGSS